MKELAATMMSRPTGEMAGGDSLASEIQRVRIPRSVHRIVASGFGSAFHAARSAAPAFERAARISLEAVSAASREDAVLRLQAGPETGVLATLSFSSLLHRLVMLAIATGRTRGILDARQFGAMRGAADRLALQAEGILRRDTFIRNCARKYREGFEFLFVGRGGHYGTALEAAFQMNELCPGTGARAAAGDLDRELIDHRTVVVVIAPGERPSPRFLAALNRHRARGAVILAVATESDLKLADASTHVFEIPTCDEIWSPLLAVLPLQMLARFRALELS